MEQSGITDKTKVQVTLPRLGFELSGIDYDPTRHLNKVNKRVARIPGENASLSFQEVPYNIGFSLYCFTRTMDDNLQIIEQIAPQFAPEFIVTLNLNKIDTKLDVPIVLQNVGLQEQYEGNFLDRRVIASVFNFVCKTRLYSEIKQQSVVVSSSIALSNILGDTTDSSETISTLGATGSTGDGGYTAGDYYEL